MNPDEQKKKSVSDPATIARTAILADFRACFTSTPGINVLAALKLSAGCGKPSFLPTAAGGPLDPLAAAFRDGRKSIIDEIEAHLSVPEDAGTGNGPAAIK